MMFKEIIELLDRNRSDLVTKIDVDHGLLDRLAAKHVLEAGHVKEIKARFLVFFLYLYFKSLNINYLYVCSKFVPISSFG